MNSQDIPPLRLAAQHITREQDLTPEAVVRHMLAIQAQDYNGALWAIGLRTQGAPKADVETAIRDRKIVRTWPMRGTLHFVHAADVHWLLALLAPRATAAAKRRRINMLGLTDAIVAEAEAVLRNALQGGRSIRRDQVVTLLSAQVKGITITNQHTQHLMRNFGERGIICFGPYDGKQPTFVLLDEWVPEHTVKTKAEALAELARRYFKSHGPASLKDFSGWTMLTMGDAKQAIASAGTAITGSIVGDTTLYYDSRTRPVLNSEALLLPGFDEYLLGYKDRSAVLSADHAAKVVPGGNGMFLPTLIERGQVTGLWKRQLTAKDVKFAYMPFATPAPAALTGEKAYRSFLGL